jgi:16S rRNA (uracil1498-N3)-methyltransferase
VTADPGANPGPLAFVTDLDQPRLDAEDQHHLARVRRLRVGDPLTVSDGTGGWRSARFVESGLLDDLGPLHQQPAPAPELAVGFALVKGAKPELVVQKLTELGIDRIVPFRAERSVVRWDEAKAAKAHVRLEAVARSAAAQSHRARLPVVEPVAELAALLARTGVARADREGQPPSLDHPFLLVGPEGGWDAADRVTSVPSVVLGPHVLRSETAAVTAGALLSALRVRLVGPVPD